MTARRDFLKGAAASGIFFCGCALLRATQAQSSTARALPVTVNGKRVKTIDVHSHCHFHEAVNLMGEEVKSVLPQTKGAQEHFIVIEERLKGMDAQERLGGAESRRVPDTSDKRFETILSTASLSSALRTAWSSTSAPSSVSRRLRVDRSSRRTPR